MKLVKGGVRFFLVTVGIVMLTSFTIDATDTLRGSQSALSFLAGSALEEGCPEGTTQVDLSGKSICIDMYENSVGEGCGVKNPTVSLETKANIETESCQAVSVPKAIPWTQVTYHQAKELCVKKGMRLPSALEWYEAALGTPDSEACNTDGSLTKTGSYTGCVSSRGIYDAVGNVWEWVDGEVVDGMYGNRTLPEDGYVQEVDIAGVATVTGGQESELYNSDYFWSDAEGTYAVIRGGFHGSRADAGLYSVHAKIEPSFAGTATGFRCVGDL